MNTDDAAKAMRVCQMLVDSHAPSTVCNEWYMNEAIDIARSLCHPTGSHECVQERVVRLEVKQGQSKAGGNFYIATSFGSLLLSQLPDYHDHVVGYAYRRPDGTERIEPQMTVCWYEAHDWTSMTATCAAVREYRDCVLASLTHVLWRG